MFSKISQLLEILVYKLQIYKSLPPPYYFNFSLVEQRHFNKIVEILFNVPGESPIKIEHKAKKEVVVTELSNSTTQHNIEVKPVKKYFEIDAWIPSLKLALEYQVCCYFRFLLLFC